MPNCPQRHGTAEQLFALLDARERAHGGYSQDPGNYHGGEGWRGAPAIGTPGGGYGQQTDALNERERERQNLNWDGSAGFHRPSPMDAQIPQQNQYADLTGALLARIRQLAAQSAPRRLMPTAQSGMQSPVQQLPAHGGYSTGHCPHCGAAPGSHCNHRGGYIGLNPAGRAFNAPEGLGGFNRLAGNVPMPHGGYGDPSQALAVEMLRRRLMGR